MSLYANVVNPDLMTQYLLEESWKGLASFQSGLLVQDSRIGEKISNGEGGELVKIRAFADLTGDSEVESDTVAAGATALTSNTYNGVIHLRRKAFVASDLASTTSGADPVGAIQSGLLRYWSKELNKVLINSISGVVKSDIESGDLVITNNQNGANITSGLVIDTLAKGGETIKDYSTVILHPNVYAKLWKDDLIIPASLQVPFDTYMGMQVIIDSTSPVVTEGGETIYATVFARRGAVSFDENIGNLVGFELGRDPAKGLDYIYSRRRFVIHPSGVNFTGTTVAGVSPTNAELWDDTNWEIKQTADMMGLTCLRHGVDIA